MIPRPTSDFTELVLHVLAHVYVGGAGCLYDPRYVAWARDRAPPELERLLHEDAAVLTQAWSGGRMPTIVHAWPELFGTLAELRACATHELRALDPTQVRTPAVLSQLVAADRSELELLHATMCALAPWFAGWRTSDVEPVLDRAGGELEAWLGPAIRVLPSLAAARIELAWALGPRGRGLPSRIVVGAPAPWHDPDPRGSVVVAMHEQAVIDSGHDRYVHAEWAALTGLAARMVAAPAALRQAHARWLASLELGPLLTSLYAVGRITVEQRGGLLHDRDARAEQLAALASHGLDQ